MALHSSFYGVLELPKTWAIGVTPMHYSSAVPILLSFSQLMLYVAYSKLCRGKLFKRKRKPHTMSEKRHKINKFANYQNKMVWNSPALTAMFLFLLKDLKTIGPWLSWRNAHYQYTNPISRPLIMMIAWQVVKTSFGLHLREWMGNSLPWFEPRSHFISRFSCWVWSSGWT